MRFTNNATDRIVKKIDYIPLQLRTDAECQATEYYTIRKGDCSLLELAFDSETATIHRITLLICEEYRKLADPYRTPANHKNGDVLAEAHGETDSSVFYCEIYPNAVKVVVSDAYPCVCIASDNTVWELTEQGALVSVCVVDPTGEASEHCFKELEANRG